MRDVTDKVTGDLPGMEQKRGRGRPPTGKAMSNAERQRAFRARRKALSTNSVTVTIKPVEIDAYDDCRLEVEALRDELASARATIDALKTELWKAHHGSGAKKGVTRKRVTKND